MHYKEKREEYAEVGREDANIEPKTSVEWRFIADQKVVSLRVLWKS